MKGALLESRRTVAGAELVVERTGIRFWNVTPERVRIEIEVENRGDTWSEPTPLRVEAAAFGAFVPWTPLTELTVPPIGPRGVDVVRTDVRRSTLNALGDSSGPVRPPRLTAGGLGDPDRRRSPSQRLRMGLDRLMKSLLRMRTQASKSCDFTNGSNPHWVGNINVLIGSRATERHMAQALRIYPGRVNLAMFQLGGDAREYVMNVQGDAVAWEHDLLDVVGGSLRGTDGTFSLTDADAITTGMVFFACCPPEGSERGSTEVHVRQLPSGREAVVEFSLDANAAGPGCYTL